MIGERVEHPHYGAGQVVATYRNGTEWLVRFSSGLRFRRPRAEFNGQAPHAHDAPAAPLAFDPPAPMPQSRWEARQLVEALRLGVAPARHVHALTVGMEEERESVRAALTAAHGEGGALRVALGEYGAGKSHLVEWSAQEALRRNFLVATTSLDLQELPPHRPFDIYSSLARTLRYPDSDERGLGPLLEAASATPRTAEQYRALTGVEWDPLQTILAAYATTPSARQRNAWRQWLEGGRRVRRMNPATPRAIRFPSLYKVGHNGRQLGYLLGGLSALARLSRYSGLCVLVDEAESYSLLSPLQRPKGSLFFKAMIYAALGAAQPHITADELPQHRWRDYPATFGEGQSLFFLFTVTHSDNSLPLDSWLDPTQLLLLDSHPTPQQVGQFLLTVQGYHGQAYGYEPGDRQGQVRRAAAELLAQGIRADRLSIRGLVRLAVELYDLLHLHPDYDTATLLDELREQMRGA